MHILVVGTGYVGLVTGLCFSEMGHDVICLDINQEKIGRLQQGISPIYEPGLDEMLERNLKAQRIQFTTDYRYGVSHSSLICLALPTPQDEDGSSDLRYMKEALMSIAEVMEDDLLIVNKSTVPVGTAHMVQELLSHELQKRGKNHSFDIVSNPEFLKEGDAIADFMKPDRIVLGVDSKRAETIMRTLYAPFVVHQDRILVMDPPSAEMTKYASNAMLACRISFMNELAKLCESRGADIAKVRQGMGSDHRIGTAFLYAGVGYGGSCFPKDVTALRAMYREQGHSAPLLSAINEVNEKQKKVMGEKILAYFKGEVSGLVLAIWGLSFKPGTDDIREAPAFVLIHELLKAGVHLRLFDPVAIPNAKKILKKSPQIQWCHDEFEAAKGADGVVLMTEWKQFCHVDLTRLVQEMKGAVFFDGRNQYSHEQMHEHGLDYICIGREKKRDKIVHGY